MTSSNGKLSALLAICSGNSPVNSQHKVQWRGVMMFSLICAWTNGWVNNGETPSRPLWRNCNTLKVSNLNRSAVERLVESKCKYYKITVFAGKVDVLENDKCTNLSCITFAYMLFVSWHDMAVMKRVNNNSRKSTPWSFRFVIVKVLSYFERV